jgi:hypothetical protein
MRVLSIAGATNGVIRRFGMSGTIMLGTLFSVAGSDLITFLVTHEMHPGALGFAMTLATVCPLLLAPPILYIILRLVFQLQGALDEIRTLSGLLPICSYCRKIRDENGQWDTLETYVSTHSATVFSHGICPECKEREFDPLLNRMRAK